MFGWTKGKKTKEEADEITKAPKFTEEEMKLIHKVQMDFESSRAVRMSDCDDTGFSVEDNWEDEYFLYKGGGLQWLTNFAYRSKRARRYRPNSEDNLIFNAINTLHANITASTPEVTMDSDTIKDISEKLTDASRFNDKRNDFSKAWKRWVYDFIGAGPTIAMVTWDSEWMGGKGPNRWVGDVRVDRCDKWDMYFDPAILDLETNLQDCSFIIRRPRKKLSYIKKAFDNGKHVSEMAIEDDDITQNEGNDPQQAYVEEYWHRGFPFFVPKERARKLREKAAEYEQEGDFYRAQDYYDSAKGDLEGIHVAYIADGVLLEYCPYEYEDGLYPFVYTAEYTDEKNQWGFGEIRNIKIPQIMHNKADEIELEAMATEGLGGHWYQKGAINSKQMERIIENSGKGGMNFEVDNLALIKDRTGPKVPPSISNYKEHKQRMVETVSNITPTSQGRAQYSGMPLGAIQELGQRADIRVKKAVEKLEDFLLQINQLRISRFAQFYTEDRYYRIRGTDGKTKEGTINSGEIMQEWTRDFEEQETVDEMGNPTTVTVERKERFVPEFDIKVTILSEKPTDRNYYTQLAFNLHQGGLLTVEDLYSTLEEGKLPPMNDILEHLYAQDSMKAIQAQIQQMPQQVQQMVMQQVGQVIQQFMAQLQQAQQLQGGAM